jgi:hypothetical protein
MLSEAVEEESQHIQKLLLLAVLLC